MNKLAFTAILVLGGGVTWFLYEHLVTSGPVQLSARSRSPGEMSQTNATALPEKAPMAPPVQTRQAAENNGWSSANTSYRASLGEILRAAIASSDPKRRAAAFDLAIICTPPPTLIGKEALVGLIPSNEGREKQVLAEASDSAEKLAQFCSTGDSQSIFEPYRRMPRDTLYTRILAVGRFQDKGVDGRLTQIELLSNVDVNQAALGHWVERGGARMLDRFFNGSEGQKLYLQSELLRRLSGGGGEESIWSLNRCALLSICPSSVELTPDQRQQVQRALDDVELLIRQQRWDVLFP